MSSRSATVLVIFIVAVFAFCLASVFASMTGPISIFPNETESGGILDNLSAITDDDSIGKSSYNYQDYNYQSDDSSDDDYQQVETTTDDSSKNPSSGTDHFDTSDLSKSSNNQNPNKDPSDKGSSSANTQDSSSEGSPVVETTTEDK